jgi:hypothetical protein
MKDWYFIGTKWIQLFIFSLKKCKINNHLNSLFKESRSNSLHQPNLWYDTIIFITELCKNQHLHLSPLTILNEHDGHNSKICSLTWDLVKRKKNYSTRYTMLLLLPPIKNIQYQLCQFYWFLFQIRQQQQQKTNSKKKELCWWWW